MRRIDLRKLNPSPDWRARAQSKQSEIDNGLIEAKAASSIWSELKPQLKICLMVSVGTVSQGKIDQTTQ